MRERGACLVESQRSASRTPTSTARSVRSLLALMPIPTARLTRREREVLWLVAKGYTTREIAQKRYEIDEAVETCLRNALWKMRWTGVELRRRARRLSLACVSGILPATFGARIIAFASDDRIS